MKKELNHISLFKEELDIDQCKKEKSYEELMQLNKQLRQQLDEITEDLKEFNIILEEEINERTKAEEELKESERQFRHAIEEAPMPIMLYTEDGDVIKINRTWTDLTGYTISDMPRISQWAKVSDIFTQNLESNSLAFTFNFEKRRSDGEYFIRTKYGYLRIWNFYTSNIGKLQDGQDLFMRVAIDITEEKRMGELQKSIDEERKRLYEIREYDRIKTEFFSNISHELRTPINVIFSAIQTYELTQKDCKCENAAEDRNKYMKIMKQNCNRILRLVNNLIDITKIDSGYLDINKENIEIIALSEDITLSVVEYMENKGIALVFDTRTMNVEEKIMACDPDMIERILLNLLSNAVKFTDSGGMITVDIKDGNDKIYIKIKDSGRGIPKEKLNSIFERFVQVDKSLY